VASALATFTLLLLAVSASASYQFQLAWGGTPDGNFYAPYGVATGPASRVYVADTYNNQVQKFDSAGNFVSKWGSYGSGNGQFAYPEGVATDASGNVYVADTSNNRIQKFNSSGNFMTKWGSYGSGNGQFDGPGSIALDSSGNVYVADSGNDRIQKFDSAGNFVSKWGSQGSSEGELSSPSSVAVDSSGGVYVADYGNHRIQKFDSSGNFLRMWGWGVDDGSSAFQICASSCQTGSPGSGNGQFTYPLGIATGPSGSVYVTEDGSNRRLQKFDSAGNFVSSWADTGFGSGAFSIPQSVATDTSGNVYVADYGNELIQKFDSSGNFLTQWGQGSGAQDGELDRPVEVATDPSDHVYVADADDQRIQKFDSAGNLVTKWGSYGSGNGQFRELWGITADSSGHVYVADRDEVKKFDYSGNFLTKWGSYGSGEGEFAGPQSVATDASGNVYVADSVNHRIQKFDSSGNFLRMWGWGVDDGSSAFQICTSSCQTGSPGSGNGQFNFPYGLAIDSSGDVYVIEVNGSRVQKFDSAGNFLDKWGSYGSGNGQFASPREIATDSSDNVFVADTYNNRIQMFDSSGNFLTKWGSSGSGNGQLGHPEGVAADSSGDVYVADTDNDRIQKFHAVPPDTTILNGPSDPNPTNDETPTFDFSSSEPDSSFECKVDSDPYEACDSPWETAPLADGSHTFYVQATDPVGNTDPTPASQTFTVDTIPPDTTITFGPPGTTTDSAPTFGFSSSEPGLSFECRIDSDPYEACDSPWETAPLGDGSHTFEVRAIDQAGNDDPTPEMRSFTVVPPVNSASEDAPAGGTVSTNSTTNPSDPVGTSVTTPVAGTVTIDEGSTTTTTPTGYSLVGQQVEIDAPDASAADPLVLEFLLDASLLPPGTDETNLEIFRNGTAIPDCDAGAGSTATPDPCVATRTATTDGVEFTVRTSQASSWNFGVVDTTPPNTTITSGPSSATNDPTPTFGFSSSEAASTFKCKLDGGYFSACSSPRTLAHLADGSHTFSVRATDPGQNTDATPATRTFTVRTAEVKVSGSTLVVTAAAGAKDNLLITKPSASTLRVTDAPSGAYMGSGVHTGANCTGSGDFTANCNASGITLIQIASGDQIDKVTNSTALKSSLNGGTAIDVLTGGAANDTLTGGAGADVFKGMNGNDQLFARDLTSDATIDCGGGTADKADLDLLPKDPASAVISCETKTRH